MDDIKINEFEVVPKSVVMQTAKKLAETITETPEFLEFELAYYNYRQDVDAIKAIQEFQLKQASLKAQLILNDVSDEDRRELKRLKDQFAEQPSVIRYTKAQEALVAISQEVGDLISNAIGIDYGNSCKTGGCCG